MADLSRFFSTARTFFLRYLLRTVNKIMRKSFVFLQKEITRAKQSSYLALTRKNSRKS